MVWYGMAGGGKGQVRWASLTGGQSRTDWSEGERESRAGQSRAEQSRQIRLDRLD